MFDRHAYEALFVEQHDWIQRVAAGVCRRHGMRETDAEDFASWAMLRFVEHDYAILRQFRGESALRTYLAVVIATLFREYRVHCWGRWRPSAAARRAGRVAVRLETLVHRDGYSPHQAILILRTAGETDLRERELMTLFATLPRRVAPARACEVPHVEIADERSADHHVLLDEALSACRTTEHALTCALATLPAEDERLVRLHFWNDLSVADIARTLGVPQKPLYRRLERALVRLRHALETSGVSASFARDVIVRAA